MGGLVDINQTWGNDIIVNSTGDLDTVSGSDFGQQRILRRLMTAVKGYIWQPEYGAGLPQQIGAPLTQSSQDALRANINSNIFLESRVSKNPPPVISFQTLPQGIFIQIDYVDVPTGQPVTLSFQVQK